MSNELYMKILSMNNIIFVVRDNRLLVSLNDFCSFLEIINGRSITQGFSLSEKIKVRIMTKGGPQDVLHLTTKGIDRLLCSSRKEKSEKLADSLGIVNRIKYIALETTFVSSITKAFKGYKLITQFPVERFRIDIYFPEHKLAVEFDENRHAYCIRQDLQRQNKITEILGCTFIRAKETDDIFDIINQIHNHILNSLVNTS